jgi:predicted CXXCH cytochrome family protein
MRITVRRLRFAVGAAGLAASLVLPLFFPANAVHGATEREALRSLGSALPLGERDGAGAPQLPVVAAEISARCAKCHSNCEYGTSHVGVAPVDLASDSGLPLTGEGRTTCLTCHQSHDGGATVLGASLRMPNVRRELCIACHGEKTQGQPAIQIVSPPERAVVQEERCALIGTASGLSDAMLTLRLNGAEFHLQAKDGKFYTWLRLQEGVNQIEVAQGRLVLWQGEVFHGQSASGGYQRSSSGHRTASREECLECHAKKDGTIARTTGETSTLCYLCHDRYDQKRYVHGPLAVGACLACHDPHAGYGTAHLRQERGLLCANCHAARENSPTLACNTAGKSCADCHEPHQSDARYLLKRPQYTSR